MTRSTTTRLLGTAIATALFCAVHPSMAQSAPTAKAKAAKTAAARSNNAWIVQLADAPVTAYAGGIKGLKATKPQKGKKIDPNAPAVVSYMSYLTSKHDAVLGSVGGGRKLHSYGYVFNGFAADLTADQAARLATMPGVLAVTKDEARRMDTATTPDFLGLTSPGGAWSETLGEGVIIGIVDGGIWPESLSFSDRTGTNGNATKDGKLSYQQIPGWHGKCEPGEAFNASMCNQKLIGARYYNAGWGGNAGIDATIPWEYNSPRDWGGHGTHTASTAGGNAGVPTTGPAAALGSISGIAPRARIAAYKVCWDDGGGGSCFSTDSVAAIDQAVADGVDVINFSIGGSRTNLRDPVAIAFLFAADAGVFVAASAGNSGPSSSTVAHPGPWMTTVAAGTHDRDGAGSATLGDGSTVTGSSLALAGGVGPAPFIYSADAGLPGADPTAVALCFSSADGGNQLDPAKVTGKIVLCDRGITARVNKSRAVQEAGGIGMILVNTSPASLNADLHSVPSVHVQSDARAALIAYATTPGATATIQQASLTPADAPFTAEFSSRGPLQAAGGDLLKPDLIAPGQDVLAAVAPPGNGGQSFALYSGTSMSSPHVAGLAALMKQKHPTWSPMMIKSALMTTGSDVLDGGTPAPNTNPVLIFRQGAGHVQPNLALDPGLVYDSNFNDWLALICAKQPEGLTATCESLWSAGFSRDASDMNVASIAIGDMAGVQTVTRRLTNVSGGELTVQAAVTPMAGITATVSPSTLTLAKGETKAFSVTFTQTAAALNSYVGGQLTWTGGNYTVRSPIVVRPVAMAAPAEVSGTAAGISYGVTFGFSAPFTATPRGLVAALETVGNVVDDPANDINVALSTGVGITVHPVNVPAGTTYARFSLFDNKTDGNDDLDLYVFRPDGSYHGGSGSGTSAEEVNVGNPVAGTWLVVVHGWQTDGPDANYTLFSWTLGNAGAGNMTVTAPSDATIGATGTIVLDFTGLAPATKYLGSVVYGGAAGMPAPTIVRVDTP